MKLGLVIVGRGGRVIFGGMKGGIGGRVRLIGRIIWGKGGNVKFGGKIL